MKIFSLILAIVTTLSSPCFAVFDFSDNFNDGVIDSAFWNVSGDGVYESGGVLNLERNSSVDSLSSKNSFSGLFDIAFDMTLVNIDWQDSYHGISLLESDVGGTRFSNGISFGFSKNGRFYSSQHTIHNVYYDYSDSYSIGQTYSLHLMNDLNNVHLYVNDSLLFTSSFSPSNAFYIHFPGTYTDGGSGVSTISNIDNFSFTLIPEPTTLLLLGMGGLLMRKRK